MKTTEGLFSIRIVVADFYMNRPISGLDPTYSDFRGHEIKSIPVIRIFGSKPDGEKTCMHVHGVFPYFYVPFVEGIAPDSDQLTYQIAASLDKAINISLGQTNSQSQHVFKIQLVKGRPFYGYHHKEHQFLKIFLYNPRFVKKAANLLLNGAILGKSFQPHESHVPYILQFFIDYNLYGMSFLHVPMEIVKYRQSDEYEVPVGFENEQILSQKITRVSTSRHEVDIAAGFILNRFEHLNKETGNTNPGIESIWQDERVRRKKLSDEQEVPPLEIPPSQERLLAKPTESDIFYKAALQAKLALENSGEKLLNASILSTSTINERKQKFNLVKLLENSVYPSECSQAMNATLANASKIPDHISSNSLFHTSMRGRSTSRSSVSIDDSFVDEEIVLSLSQPQQKLSLDQTLQGEDFELLEVMQQLEEDEAEIDLDSTLAPLSQVPKNVLQMSNEIPKEVSPKNLDNVESEEEEDDMNYTISMDSVDKILMDLSQPQNNEKIPQLDGGDDLWSTPKKRRMTRNYTKLKGSPRSPKVPSASKYAPLDITINKSPIVTKEDINGNDSTSVVNITPFSASSNGQLVSCKSPSIRIKRLLINLDKEFSNLTNRKRHKTNDIDVPPADENSFIVCNLKPRSPMKSPLIIEKYDEVIKSSSPTNGSPPENPHLKKCKVKMKRVHFKKKVASAENKESSVEETILTTSFNGEIDSEIIYADEKQLNENDCVLINLDEDDHEREMISIEKMEQNSRTSETIGVDDYSLKNGIVNGPTDIKFDNYSFDNYLFNGTEIEDELRENENACGIVNLNKCGVTNELKTTDESVQNEYFAKIINTEYNGLNNNVDESVNNNVDDGVNNNVDDGVNNNVDDGVNNNVDDGVNNNVDDGVNNNVESKTIVVDDEVWKEDFIPSDNNSDHVIVYETIIDDESEKAISVSENNNNDKDCCIPAEEEESPEESEPDRTNLDANGFVKPDVRAVEVRNEIINRRKSWSPCNVSKEFDRKNNFYPKPGPSGLRKGKKRETKKPASTPSSKIQTRLKTKQQQQKDITEIIEEECVVEQEEDLNICSFYEKSMVIDSPSLFSEFSPQTPKSESELEEKSEENCNIQSIIQISCSQLVTITPRHLPPTFKDADEKSIEFGIPDEVFPEPFYGDDADVTGKREIGPTVLNIPGRSLNSFPDFESLIPNLKGLNVWRKNKLDTMLGDNVANELQNANSLKESFSCKERVIIVSQNPQPSREDAKNWLINMASNRTKSKKRNNNEDSPIKVRKEKVKMILDESTLGEDGGACDLSQKTISLTPLTPDNMKNEKMETKPSTTSMKKITPINKICDQTTPLSALQKFRERRRSRARLSLAKKLRRLGSVESNSSGTDSETLKIPTNINGGLQIIQQPILVVDDSNDSENFSERSFGSQQISDLCSEKIKQVLERTSFIRNLSIMENHGGSDVSFGLSGVTLDNTFGFKISLQNLQDAKADIEHNHLTVFSLEIHANTRGDLKPDPQYDAVDCLFFNISHDAPETEGKINKSVGCIMVCDNMNPSLNGVATRYVPVKSEFELFDKLLELCQEWNPDIFVGYEIEMGSWGYLIDRAHVLGMNLKAFLSRVPTQKVREAPATDEEKEGYTDLDIELKLCGRILLDVWRLMRSEIALTSYTFENVMFHILHRRVPLHSYRDLTKWYSSSNTRWIVLEYYLERVNGTMELLDQLDLIGRTSEMAKLIGIQFYEVLSRGSQFRVESMMLRIAKPKNLVPVSPSIQQRAHSRAPEYLPLILEPKSRFYADPMIVLDFQSLYPSMIIAYNYCFSTCLGRVEHLGQSTPFEFGCSQLRVSRSELNRLIDNDLITISPCGVVFVKSEVREGVLPRMLKEILETRIMVKQTMKLHKTNSILQRVLHSRQLGLKLMANVTYGYTSANFSGRMACVEVADSVVGKGRETLERAIKLVEANKDWRVKVVYGDTDSLFVLVPGRSRAEAFRIGEEIAKAVTNDNPQPVKLKLEKVYQPCILQTKKRYVGYMYESSDQEEPVYEAKGIETVRRDGCPAVAKMLEKCLRILFESCDVSEVKRYVCRQFTKLLTGNANVQDLIFAKEFRGKNGYKPGACVPALELTRKWIQTDPRSEPRRGERVPFLIVNGPPGLPLIRLVRSPHEYLSDEGLKINAIYYITKAIIPPLNRCLLLIGADVNEWFAELPRKHIALPTISTVTSMKRIFQDVKKSTISQYFASSNCIIDCGRHTKAGICTVCTKDSQKCTAVLSQKISKLERSYYLTRQLCQSCCGRLDNIDCCSLDCPVLFVSNLKSRDRKQVQHFEDIFKDKFSVHNLL